MSFPSPSETSLNLASTIFLALAHFSISLTTSTPGLNVGVLHVYRLEQATPRPGQRLRLLRNAESSEGIPSATQLAEAAEKGGVEAGSAQEDGNKKRDRNSP